MQSKFKVGDLVRYANSPARSGFGIVTRGDYIGNWISAHHRAGRGDGEDAPGNVHVDVWVAGKEIHCLAEWLEKVNG